MKLRFGWGPVDGAEGMQKNIALVRTVRETVGDGIDVMADALHGLESRLREAHVAAARAVQPALA
jgi:L-alanine-DL-glutamate epimerase-like enolase superfamily enzyme